MDTGGGVDTVAGANGSSAVDCRMSTQIQFDYQNDISKGKGQPIQNKSCFKANWKENTLNIRKINKIGVTKKFLIRNN
jgi:hypothetical protein